MNDHKVVWPITCRHCTKSWSNRRWDLQRTVKAMCIHIRCFCCRGDSKTLGAVCCALYSVALVILRCHTTIDLRSTNSQNLVILVNLEILAMTSLWKIAHLVTLIYKHLLKINWIALKSSVNSSVVLCRAVTITTFCCAIYCTKINCDKQYYCHFKTILFRWLYNYSMTI